MKSILSKNGIKNKVVDISRRLFIEQGYTKTTIRQIIREAGITTGSLYHFFQNKEDILREVIAGYFNMAADMADNTVTDGTDPGLRFALEIALQLEMIYHHAHLAELYLAAYNSWNISERFALLGAQRNRELFKAYNPDATALDFYTRTLALKGILHSFVHESVHCPSNETETRIAKILEVILHLFNVPPDQSAEKIRKALRTIKARSIKPHDLHP